MRKSTRLGVAAAVALTIGIGARAGDEKDHGSDKDHVMVRPDDVKWGPAPPAWAPVQMASAAATTMPSLIDFSMANLLGVLHESRPCAYLFLS